MGSNSERQSIKSLESKSRAIAGGAPLSTVARPVQSFYRGRVTVSSSGWYTVAVIDEAGTDTATTFDFVRSFPPNDALEVGALVLLMFRDGAPRPSIVGGSGSGGGAVDSIFITGPVFFSQ